MRSCGRQAELDRRPRSTFIDAHRGTYGVEPICEVLPIAPATYFRHKTEQAHPARRSERAQRDDWLTTQIQQVWDETASTAPARSGDN